MRLGDMYEYDPPEDNSIEVESYKDYVKLYLDETIQMDEYGDANILAENSVADNMDRHYDDVILSEVYDDFILTDLDSAIERVYDIEDMVLPEDSGKYRVTAEVTLVYEVSNIRYDPDTRWDEDSEPEYNFDDVDIRFLPKESFVENIKFTKLA